MTSIEVNRRILKLVLLEDFVTPDLLLALGDAGYISVPEWSSWQPPVGIPHHGCFGYIDGNLVIGTRHHQAIMAELLANGWTWEHLMFAPQVWGWFTLQYSPGQEPHLSLSFVSDAATMNEEAAEPCKQEFAKVFNVPSAKGSWESNGGDVKARYGDRYNYGGDFDSHYGDGDNPQVIYTEITPIPDPPEVALA